MLLPTRLSRSAQGSLGAVATAVASASLALAPATWAADPSAEPAGSGRLHTITWNACDQFNTDKIPCRDDTTHERAVYIENIMLEPEYLPQVAMFQEICYSTYRRAKELLGDEYRGDFRSTVERPDQCGSGNSGKWGVAYIVKGPLTRESALPLPDDVGEPRVLFCGRTTIYSTFRVCTTHLTASSDENPQNPPQRRSVRSGTTCETGPASDRQSSSAVT